MRGPVYTPPVGGTANAPGSIRLRLEDATLYDPANTVTFEETDAAGKCTVTITGGRTSDDPGANATWIWPLVTADGSTPNFVTRWALRAMLSILRYPAQKFVGDTWIRMGICALGDPNGAAWQSRSYGWKWLAAAGAPRLEVATVVAGAAPTMISPATAQYAARAIEMAFQRCGTGQTILPVAAVPVDGSNVRTGTDLGTTNVPLVFGAGVPLGVCVTIGRNGPSATPDTVYFQADMQEILEWDTAIGGMDAGAFLNVLCVGTSICLGTGWNMDALGALFGWRRKLEDLWIADEGLPMLRYWGSQGGGTNNGYMLLGRHMHEGRSGFTAAQLDSGMVSYLDALTVTQDIILLDTFTNSAQAGVSAASAIASTQGCIDKIRAHARAGAGTLILLSNGPTLANSTHETTLATYRALLGTLTGGAIIVDDVTGFNVGTMTDDGVHPNSLGYDLFALRRFNAIKTALGL